MGALADLRPVSHPTQLHLFICLVVHKAICVALDLDQCHISRLLMQLQQEWEDNIKVYHLLEHRVEVIKSPFAQNV